MSCVQLFYSIVHKLIQALTFRKSKSLHVCICWTNGNYRESVTAPCVVSRMPAEFFSTPRLFVGYLKLKEDVNKHTQTARHINKLQTTLTNSTKSPISPPTTGTPFSSWVLAYLHTRRHLQL